MQDCSGEEITQEWLYHLGVPVGDIPELAATGAMTVPVMMPYVTAFSCLARPVIARTWCLRAL